MPGVVSLCEERICLEGVALAREPGKVLRIPVWASRA